MQVPPRKDLNLTPARRQALSHLVEAAETALELGQAPVAFACQLAGLHALDVTDSSLRWLVLHGLAEHRRETTRSSQSRRVFQACANLCFTEASCFHLTAAGLALARRLCGQEQVRLDPPHPVANGHLPHYDAGRRMLFFNGQLVKQFKVRAENQELILLAFEEENWPPHLSDPLPGRADIDAKRRLGDAIKNLNTHQIHPLLRFHGDGTGTGILWEKL